MSSRVSAKIFTLPRNMESSTMSWSGRSRRWLAGGLVVAIGLVGLVGVLSRTSLLDIDSVTVEGAAPGRTDQVIAAARLRAGAPLLAVDEDAVERRLRNVAWVEDAQVSAPLSGRVSISVVERQPVALVQTTDRKWAEVGSNGRVLSVSDAPAKLPAILETQVPPEVGAQLDVKAVVLLRVSALLPDSLRPQVTQMVVQSGNLRLGLTSGTIVELGNEQDLGDKLMAAATVLSHTDPKTVSVLDVRSPHLPIATPKER